MKTKSTTPELKVRTIPDVKDYKMSDWQIKQIASFIYEHRDDVHKYIEEHREEYEEWLREEGIEDK